MRNDARHLGQKIERAGRGAAHLCGGVRRTEAERLPSGDPPSIRVLRAIRRRGREAEGGGLLNRYTGNTVSEVQILSSPPYKKGSPKGGPFLYGGVSDPAMGAIASIAHS